MNLEQVLAQAVDELSKRHYRRGKLRVKLGRGQKYALLHTVVRAYARRYLASATPPIIAPQLRLTRRALHDWRCELGRPTLPEAAASDSLYEWSRLLHHPQVMDVEDGTGRILRVTLAIVHEQDSEVFDLSVAVDRDRNARHDYEAVVQRGLDFCDLDLVFAGVRPRVPALEAQSASDAPLGHDLQVVTRFLSRFAAAVAEKFPNRIRKARARIDADKREKKPLWVTVVAVLAILLAGWYAFTRISKTSLAETDIDIRDGSWSRTFAFEQNKGETRVVDPKTKEPLSPWANAIVDPTTGDSIIYTGRQADGKYIYKIRVGNPPSGVQSRETICGLPPWWYRDDGFPEPGFAVEEIESREPTKASTRRALFMIVPNIRSEAVMAAVKNGNTIVEIGGRTRWHRVSHTLLDNRWPALVFTSEVNNTEPLQLTVYWQTADGQMVDAQYQLLCPTDMEEIEFARTQDVKLSTRPPRYMSWPLCSGSVLFAYHNDQWVRLPADKALERLDRTYGRQPKLPDYYQPRSSFSVIPRRAFNSTDYGPPPG